MAHEAGMMVLVDEAHGAHLAFMDKIAPSRGDINNQHSKAQKLAAEASGADIAHT